MNRIRKQLRRLDNAILRAYNFFANACHYRFVRRYTIRQALDLAGKTVA